MAGSQALFPFGYGPSCTRFEYDEIDVPDVIGPDDLQVRFELTHTGFMDGDEVVLFYINDFVSSVATPVKKRVAYERVSLVKGRSRTLEIIIENRHPAFLGPDMKPPFEPRQFQLSVGDQVLEFEGEVSDGEQVKPRKGK